MAAKIAITATQIQFGSANPNVASNQSFLISNTGDAPLTGTVTAPSTGAEFAISPSAFTIAAGQSATITITYTPVVEGENNGFVLITSNDVAATILPIYAVCRSTPASDLPPQPIDYSYSKQGTGLVYPVNALADSWGVLEPLVTPAQLKTRHLFGIPMVSYAVDPLTGKRQVLTDPILADYINRAVSQLELESHLDIFPKQYREKHPFDRQAYSALGYLMLPHHPVQSLEKLSVTASNNSDLYLVPPAWVETAYLHTGQINIIPMTIAFQMGGFFVPTNSPNGGAAFLSILGQNPWIPAYWQTDYTTGFPDGKFPQIINELVGITASMDILSSLASTNARNSSHSVGVDSLSQSVSTPGPQIYDVRLQALSDKKAALLKKLRVRFGSILFTGVI